MKRRDIEYLERYLKVISKKVEGDLKTVLNRVSLELVKLVDLERHIKSQYRNPKDIWIDEFDTNNWTIQELRAIKGFLEQHVSCIGEDKLRV